MTENKIEVLLTKKGVETLTVNGFLLHSKYDPIKEAERIIEKELEDNFSFLLYGYGKGYIAKELQRKIKDNQSFIIFDPIFKELEDDSINDEVIIDFEQLEKKISVMCDDFDRRIKIILSPNYDKFETEKYKKVLKLVSDIQKEDIVNENTVRFFSEIWQENYIKNLLYIYEDNTLAALEHKYDCPVVIASGGPSLTKQLPLLKKMRDNIVLIASGSTINSLLADDIEPDYIVAIDGGMANFEHFKSLKVKKAKLIYALSNNYNIQENFKNDRYSFIY